MPKGGCARQLAGQVSGSSGSPTNHHGGAVLRPRRAHPSVRNSLSVEVRVTDTRACWSITSQVDQPDQGAPRPTGGIGVEEAPGGLVELVGEDIRAAVLQGLEANHDGAMGV